MGLRFAATAVSAVDGEVSGRVTWTSSRDGTIGSGASFATATLSAGVHTVTATAVDGTRLAGSASVTVSVDPDAAP